MKLVDQDLKTDRTNHWMIIFSVSSYFSERLQLLVIFFLRPFPLNDELYNDLFENLLGTRL